MSVCRYICRLSCVSVRDLRQTCTTRPLRLRDRRLNCYRSPPGLAGDCGYAARPGRQERPISALMWIDADKHVSPTSGYPTSIRHCDVLRLTGWRRVQFHCHRHGLLSPHVLYSTGRFSWSVAAMSDTPKVVHRWLAVPDQFDRFTRFLRDNGILMPTRIASAYWFSSWVSRFC